MYERKHEVFFISEPGLLASLNMTSSNCIHLPSNHLSLFLMTE
jgi:hypothetical protein